MRLENKVAIVSGAASGMGAATARRFAKEGAKVVIADMLEAEGKAVAAEITAAGHGHRCGDGAGHQEIAAGDPH